MTAAMSEKRTVLCPSIIAIRFSMEAYRKQGGVHGTLVGLGVLHVH